MKKKILGIFVCTLFFVAASSATGTMNVSINQVENKDTDACFITSQSNILKNSINTPFEFEYDVQTPTGDTGCLGVEFDGEFFWITGRDSPHNDIHKLHKFDNEGNHIITYEQGTSSTWGWRDLAWDGEYLYASDEDELAKIDPADGSVVTLLEKPAGLTVCRGLAVNTANGHFFSANWGSAIYEFNPEDGTVYNTYLNDYSIYGLAYDDFSDDGPFLWVYSQDPEENPQVQISQFDLTSETYTDVIYQGYWNPGYDTNMAGGACFYVDGTKAMFVGLSQSSPDVIFGLNVGNEPPGAPDIDGPASGSAGTLYEYDFTSIDPDGDDVEYYIDWGDENTTEWTSSAPSNTPVTVSHTWAENGDYIITAKARDIYGLEGPEETFSVTMPKNKAMTNTFIIQIFQRFPNAFPILRYIMGL